MGLVEIRHGQGTFVADRAQVHLNAPAVTQMSDDLLEARQIIEVELARLAAERHTDEDIAKMEVLLDERRSTWRPIGPIIEASRFHLLVADAARNKILADMIRPFFQIAFERGPELYQTIDGYAEWELDQHRRILEAIESGNSDLARSRMFDHVTSIRARSWVTVPARRRAPTSSPVSVRIDRKLRVRCHRSGSQRCGGQVRHQRRAPR